MDKNTLITGFIAFVTGGGALQYLQYWRAKNSTKLKDFDDLLTDLQQSHDERIKLKTRVGELELIRKDQDSRISKLQQEILDQDKIIDELKEEVSSLKELVMNLKDKN